MQGIGGPMFMARDTHALSGPAQHTALEVLAGNHVHTVIQHNDGVTPTPVISRAILVHNRGRRGRLGDGIDLTKMIRSRHRPVNFAVTHNAALW
jgi:phosphoglucomutase